MGSISKPGAHEEKEDNNSRQPLHLRFIRGLSHLFVIFKRNGRHKGDNEPNGRKANPASGAKESSHSEAFEKLLTQLENQISYRFRNRALLKRALTHRSYANEQPDPRPMHNEALEFLGDAVLEFLISSWLLELHPAHNEGTLSKMRAYAVSAVNLQKHALRLKLGNYLLLNRGEEKTGGRAKTALQVDAYEALIAAIYLDGGIDAAKGFIRKEFATTFSEIDPQNLTSTDYKTALQERLQSYGLPTPHYAIVESIGPDHRRVFQVELRVNGYCIATGEGTTIKGAHQIAARSALDNLEKELDRLKPATPVQELSPIPDAPDAIDATDIIEATEIEDIETESVFDDPDVDSESEPK